ncbi:MAG: tripartite tricarboxylate transporter permease [Rhodocyclaceae bacterium]
MSLYAQLSHGLALAVTPLNLGLAALGSFLGTLIGALPGLGPINGVAILLPIAYAIKLPAASALILLAAVYYGCEYGGRISAILLNVPGDAGAIMTGLDGHPLALKGMAGPALSISGWSSFVGAIVAFLGIVLMGPLLARWALLFGPAEYFALMVFAFACLSSMVGRNPVKTLLGACLGLALATVGVDSGTGVYRYTFGSVHLSDGISFLVVVIGLFSVSEILILLEQSHAGQKMARVSGRMLFTFAEMRATWWPTLRSSVTGFLIGVLPGTGASIASAVSYMTEKRLLDAAGTFGKGDLRGLAAPEAANNAAAGGALVPMLTLGVPGSGTTAILLGALTLYDITPGPLLFTQQPDLVWSLIASMLVANVMLLVMNLPLVGIFVRLLQIPYWLLVPGIAAISFIGVWSVHGTSFDLLLMTGLGVVAWILRKFEVPLAPVILGFVLGDIMEQELRRALSISGGDWGILASSPLSVLLWGLAAAMAFAPAVLRRLRALP